MDAVALQSRAQIEKGSKSFAAAARLFDADTRDSASMLYAWCRYCDDVIDGQVLGFADQAPQSHTPEARLALLHERTTSAYRGEATDDPVMRAFQRVAHRHAIPESCALDLLQGFRMDVEEFRYRTIDETLTYCYHVAGVVGVMMAMVMGVRDEETLDRACDLGLAFQLTNISRDVLEDAAMGRCYLPEDWLLEAGVDTRHLERPSNRDGLARVARRLVGEAEPYYDSALTGLSRLPFRCAWAIAGARGVYRAIGRDVHRLGPAAWDRRVSTSRGQKVRLLMLAGVQAAAARTLGRWRTPAPRVGLWTRPGG
ncbi:phytoene/squalene synthase family protein [Aquisalimonas sp.]|uniref:phytoene/squalene synthase family protein n=1 Tax=Aquisalimonas sp. TaxID=1872621 RepID=UPI0025BF5A5A|nr:phytoene/squalene synthase family protein [Aquisalimonas sp.]